MEYLFYIGLLVSLFVFPFQIYISAIVSAFLIIIIIFQKYKDKSLINNTFRGYNLLLVFWFFWGVISYIWVPSKGMWLNHILILFTGMSYSLIVPTLLKKDVFFERAMNLIVISYFVNMIIGIFETQTGRYLFTLNRGNIDVYASLKYPVSFFYNTNDYIVFLIFGLLVFLFYFDFKKQTSFSLFLKIISFILTTYLVTMAQSRIGFYSLIILGGLYLYLSIKSKIIRRLIWFLVFTLITIVYFKFENILTEIGLTVTNDYSGNIRINLIKNSLQYFVDSNYIGVGAGGLKYYLTNYPIFDTALISDAHNWWIEILATYGMGVFGIYIYIY